MRAGLVVCLLAAVAAAGCGGGGGRSLGAFCSRVHQMRDQNGNFNITSPTDTQALDHSISQIQTISSVAPKDIAPAVETVVNSLEAIRSGDTAAMQRNQQAFAQASDNLAAYINAHCGRTA